LVSDLKNVELPPVVAENVFRLLQESLNNVVKHADASHVGVQIEVNPNNVDINGQSLLQVVVSDNGVGQALDAVDGSRLGILGMKERVDLMGGSLKIDSPENSGTTVSVQIPLR
jgi:two-component system sensor histidine kinase DegS